MLHQRSLVFVVLACCLTSAQVSADEAIPLADMVEEQEDNEREDDVAAVPDIVWRALASGGAGLAALAATVVPIGLGAAVFVAGIALLGPLGALGGSAVVFVALLAAPLCAGAAVGLASLGFTDVGGALVAATATTLAGLAGAAVGSIPGLLLAGFSMQELFKADGSDWNSVFALFGFVAGGALVLVGGGVGSVVGGVGGGLVSGAIVAENDVE